jgi:predicted DNA-binding transcriptional regulator AlpA
MRLLRFDDLVALGVVSNRMTLSRWIENNKFPSGILLGPNSLAWRESDVHAWIESRAVDAEAAASHLKRRDACARAARQRHSKKRGVEGPEA